MDIYTFMVEVTSVNDISTPRKSNDSQCTFDITCDTVHNDTSTPRKSNDLQCTFDITCITVQSNLL